jgi:hypothetical protein
MSTELAGLHPDLLIVDESVDPDEFSACGVSDITYMYAPSDIASVVSSIEALGKASGHLEGARLVAAQLNDDIRQVENLTDLVPTGAQRKIILSVPVKDFPRLISDVVFLSSLLSSAGARVVDIIRQENDRSCDYLISYAPSVPDGSEAESGDGNHSPCFWINENELTHAGPRLSMFFKELAVFLYPALLP